MVPPTKGGRSHRLLEDQPTGEDLPGAPDGCTLMQEVIAYVGLRNRHTVHRGCQPRCSARGVHSFAPPERKEPPPLAKGSGSHALNLM